MKSKSGMRQFIWSFLLVAALAMFASCGGGNSGASSNNTEYAYVANWASSNISQYTIGANGVLTAMAASAVGAGSDPFRVTVDPSGKYAYVANFGQSSGLGGGNISQYTIG